MIILHYGNKKKLIFPSEPAELTRKQFINIAPYLVLAGEEIHCKVAVLRMICGKSTFGWKLLPTEIVSFAIDQVEWLFAKDLMITDQLIPEYKGLHGPTGEFDNLRLGEFHFTEMYYRDYVSDSSEDSLNCLIATMYRPPKPKYDKEKNADGDIRENFNHHLIPYLAKKVKRWPSNVKLAIFAWYAFCRIDLEKKHEWAFKNDDPRPFTSRYDAGMYAVIRSLASDKLGSVAAVEQMYVHDAMLEIGLLKEDQQRLESEMKPKHNGNIQR